MKTQIRSVGMILGIILVCIGISITMIALMEASSLPASGTAAAGQAQYAFYYIAEYSVIVTVIGIALIVDKFLGNPFSYMQSLLSRRAKLSTFLKELELEKQKLSSSSLSPSSPSYGTENDSNIPSKERSVSVDKRLKEIRRLEISVEAELRELDWNIREAGAANSPKHENATTEKQQDSKVRESPKTRWISRLLDLSPSQSSYYEALNKILSDVIAISKEEKQDKDSLKILLQDRANQLRALSRVFSSEKELSEIEDIYYVIVRLSRGHMIEERILSRFPTHIRKKIEKAEAYILR